MSLRYALFNRKKLKDRYEGAEPGLGGGDGLTFETPKSTRDYEVSRVAVGGIGSGAACIVMRNRRARGKRALLYLYGGDMVSAPRSEFVTYASNIGVASERDVWFALYPLCGETGIVEATDAVIETYRLMLEEYDAADIAFYGFSTGGLLALGALGRVNETKADVPMPGLLVTVSPFACPASKFELKAMRALDLEDIELSSDLIVSMRDVLAAGRNDVPEYLLSLEGLDCTGFPPTTIYYGTYECLSAKAPALGKALEAAGVDYQVNLARGMCHCYCTDLKFPEARQDYEEILQILG